MITLTLLHPLQSVPVQSWTFNAESKIRIGRSTNNEVVLYSAVVSRHHVEIRKVGENWEVVNLGANGTYIDGERISQTAAADGMIIRLASSGPKILIKIESKSLPVHQQSIGDATSVSEPVQMFRRKINPKDTLIGEQ
ncbi:FHA domain-containing protein [Pleurocapsales cyanobacterium LEGE 06147]|nr:FHA domain-containing protein [Pleurocapsales cyanobacterium LEGE 06147]